MRSTGLVTSTSRWLHFATVVGGLPGVSSVMTHYMNSKMEKLDITVGEFYDKAAGGQIIFT